MDIHNSKQQTLASCLAAPFLILLVHIAYTGAVIHTRSIILLLLSTQLYWHDTWVNHTYTWMGNVTSPLASLFFFFFFLRDVRGDHRIAISSIGDLVYTSKYDLLVFTLWKQQQVAVGCLNQHVRQELREACTSVYTTTSPVSGGGVVTYYTYEYSSWIGTYVWYIRSIIYTKSHYTHTYA